jgi:hypothetical protein
MRVPDSDGPEKTDEQGGSSEGACQISQPQQGNAVECHHGCRHRRKILFIILFIFLDTDPHLASVVCDLYLFSVSRYELCVCGNLCTCVHVSTNLESPPIMGNFKV